MAVGPILSAIQVPSIVPFFWTLRLPVDTASHAWALTGVAEFLRLIARPSVGCHYRQ